MDLAARWADVTPSYAAWNYAIMVLRGFGTIYLIGCAFFFIERIRPTASGQRFFKADFWNEVGYFVTNTTVTSLFLTLFTLAFTTYVLQPFVPYHVLAATIEAQPLVMQVMFALLITDIAVYVEHWFQHKFLWDFHALHHMTPEVSWLTHARVHPVNAFTIAASGMIAHFVLGISGSGVAIAAAIGVGVSAWEHSNLDFAWPKPLNYLFVSPRFHRWHHSSDAEAIDKNFCLLFPFLDLLMGTYYCPDRMPTAYGVHNADGQADRIPKTLRGQMWYPFRQLGIRLSGSIADVPSPPDPVRSSGLKSHSG